MIEYVKQLIVTHPFISTGVTLFIGVIIKELGLDVYKAGKKAIRNIGLHLRALWRVVRREKITMTSSETSSQNKWKEKQE